jgi:hypothetical protein
MRNQIIKKQIFYILFTLATIIISHQIMGLLHEWTHGLIAWIFGYKNSPFDICYGNWTLLNMDEDVNYSLLYSANEGLKVSIIAISALITNVILSILSLIIISKKTIQQKRWTFSLFYWFAVMNIAEIYSYIPLRTFSPTGDVGHFLRGLGISPLIFVFPATLLVIYGIWFILSRSTWLYFNVFNLRRKGQRIHLTILIFIIFFWFGGKAFHFYGMKNILSIWSLISCVAGLIIFIILNIRLNMYFQIENG